MSKDLIDEKPYRWEYGSLGSLVLCYDDTHPEGIPVAMCACSETAKVICEALNKTRKREQIL